jgi:hypothetical protein
LYHHSETSPRRKNFRLFLFTMESFWYLVYRVGRAGIATYCLRRQSVTKYYNTLRMDCVTKLNSLTYLRILSEAGLKALRSVLGIGIGVGVSKKRPTKAKPTQYCTIGAILTSVEVGPEVPIEVVLKPACNVAVDGIDFIYSEQSRCLSCTIRFSKIVVSHKEVATTRISKAQVITPKESGVYLNVWFKHDEHLMEVIAIDQETELVTCIYVEEEGEDEVVLPLNLVSECVARFGRA